MGTARDIESICARLAELEAERNALNEQLERLQAQKARALVYDSDSSRKTFTVIPSSTHSIFLLGF